MLEEIAVGFCKMSAAVKSAIDGKRGRVGGLENEVFMSVDKRAFALRIAAPEHEDEVLPPGVERLDSGIGQFFPTFVLMAPGAMRFHGQGGVEEKNTLLRPRTEVAAHHAVGQPLRSETVGRKQPGGCLAVDFFVDIYERWRHLNSFRHAETQPHSLTRFMVRVLTDDDHAHAVERATVEGVEDEVGRRKNLFVGIFRADKRGEHFEIWLVKFRLQNLLPGVVDAYVHGVFGKI